MVELDPDQYEELRRVHLATQSNPPGPQRLSMVQLVREGLYWRLRTQPQRVAATLLDRGYEVPWSENV